MIFNWKKKSHTRTTNIECQLIDTKIMVIWRVSDILRPVKILMLTKNIVQRVWGCQNAHELLNLRALKFHRCANHIFQHLDKISCMEFNAIYLIHRLKCVGFIWMWKCVLWSVTVTCSAVASPTAPAGCPEGEDTLSNHHWKCNTTWNVKNHSRASIKTI